MVNKSLKIWLGFLIVGLCVFCGWIYIHSLNAHSEVDGSEVRRPTTTLYGIKQTEFNEQGHIINQGKSDAIAYYQREKNIEITKPHFSIQKEGKTWLITAEKAYANEDSKSILLKGNVKVESIASKESLKTESLVYHFKTQTLETKERITIKASGLQFESNGLNAKLGDASIALFQARGEYDPNARY